MFSYQVHCPSGSPGVQSAGCHSQGRWDICNIPGQASGGADKSHPLSKEQNWNLIPNFLAFCLLMERENRIRPKVTSVKLPSLTADSRRAAQFILKAKAHLGNQETLWGPSPEMTMMGLLRMLLRTNMWISSRELYWSPLRAAGVSADAILTKLSHSSFQF